MNRDSTPITDSTAQVARSYHAYLLRLWREHEGTAWRASLQAPHMSVPLGFADLEHLISYLIHLIDQHTAAEGVPMPGPTSAD